MIAVTGPVGAGKTTEIGSAAAALQASFATCLVPLDRELDMQRVTTEGVFSRLVARVVWIASENLKLALPPAITNLVDGMKLATASGVSLDPARLVTEWPDLLRRVLREVARLKPVILFVDGLEKCEAFEAQTIVRAIGTMRDEATMVVVLSPSLTVGPESHELIESFRLFPIRAVPVRSDQGRAAEDGRNFLLKIAETRLGASLSSLGLGPIATLAAEKSGGVARTFLQLLQEAFTYARLGNRSLPNQQDMIDAIRDRAEAMRRILREGDLSELKHAAGTSGVEIPLERRARFLAHGLLLEYPTAYTEVAYPHPLIGRFLADVL